MNQQSQNITWISCAKLVAIFAVILDHMHGILFHNTVIDDWSFFSVTTFVFLSGITAYQSSVRHLSEPVGSYVIKRLMKLFIPYVTAVIFTILLTGKFFNFVSVVKEVLSFKTFGPAYYVLMALQLIAVSPLLARSIMKLGTCRFRIVPHALFALCIAYVSYLCTHYTFITDTYGAGQYAFGGVFLFIYVLGMLFAHYDFRFTKALPAGITAAITFLLHIGVFTLMTWSKNVHGDLYINTSLRNPPSPAYIIYSLVTAAFLMSFFSFIELTRIAWIQRILQILAYAGNRTMSIFLYHMLLMLYVFPHIPFMNMNSMTKIITYLAGMIVIPVLWQDFLAYCKHWIFSVKKENLRK